jgi:transposase InsO family protein
VAVANGEIGVNRVCAILGISKDTYYKSKDPKCTLIEKYSELKPKIKKIIEANPAYGYPRIKKALFVEYGEIVNHKLLLKLLKLWDLEIKRKISKRKKSWIKKTLDFLQSRANLLRASEAKSMINQPFQAVVTDITEITYRGGKAYLCVHLDYVGKMIYGYSLSLSPDSKLVVGSLHAAIAKLKSFGIRKFSKIIFHSDRGTQYTSTDYIGAIFKIGGFLSYSKKGEPGDNAVNEAFFSRLKEEKRDVFYEAKTFEELELLVKKAITYYNERRYHTSIRLLTPLEFTQQT